MATGSYETNWSIQRRSGLRDIAAETALRISATITKYVLRFAFEFQFLEATNDLKLLSLRLSVLAVRFFE